MANNLGAPYPSVQIHRHTDPQTHTDTDIQTHRRIIHKEIKTQTDTDTHRQIQTHTDHLPIRLLANNFGRAIARAAAQIAKISEGISYKKIE